MLCFKMTTKVGFKSFQNFHLKRRKRSFSWFEFYTLYTWSNVLYPIKMCNYQISKKKEKKKNLEVYMFSPACTFFIWLGVLCASLHLAGGSVCFSSVCFFSSLFCSFTCFLSFSVSCFSTYNQTQPKTGKQCSGSDLQAYAFVSKKY